MAQEIITCPNCHHDIDPKTPVQIVKRGIPRFQWWVAPLNMLFLSLMLLAIDLGIQRAYGKMIPWSIWAITGMWLLYLLAVGLTYRPEDSWILIPIFFTMFCLFLASIDWTSGDENSVLFGLSWSFYPIIVLLILFVILPIITFMGKKDKPPIIVLREIINMESANIGEKNDK